MLPTRAAAANERAPSVRSDSGHWETSGPIAHCAHRIPADVIGMQMGAEDDVDSLRRKTDGIEPGKIGARLARVPGRPLWAGLVLAHTGIDQDDTPGDAHHDRVNGEGENLSRMNPGSSQCRCSSRAAGSAPGNSHASGRSNRGMSTTRSRRASPTMSGAGGVPAIRPGPFIVRASGAATRCRAQAHCNAFLRAACSNRP